MMIPNKQYISGPPVCSNSCWVAIGSNHPSTMASSRSSRASWTPPRCRRCHHRGCWSCSKNSCSQNIIKLHKTCHILSWPSIYYWITCWDIKWYHIYIYMCVIYYLSCWYGERPADLSGVPQLKPKAEAKKAELVAETERRENSVELLGREEGKSASKIYIIYIWLWGG